MAEEEEEEKAAYDENPTALESLEVIYEMDAWSGRYPQTEIVSRVSFLSLKRSIARLVFHGVTLNWDQEAI